MFFVTRIFAKGLLGEKKFPVLEALDLFGSCLGEQAGEKISRGFRMQKAMGRLGAQSVKWLRLMS